MQEIIIRLLIRFIQVSQYMDIRGMQQQAFQLALLAVDSVTISFNQVCTLLSSLITNFSYF